MSSKRTSAAGIVYVTITLLGWSTVLLFLRKLHTEIDGWTANGWRYGMCAVVLFPFLMRKWTRGELPGDIWRRAMVPSFFNCLGQVCFGFSIYYIEPGLAGFLLRVALISSTAGAFIIFKDERVLARSPAFRAGMMLVVVGAIGTILMGSAPIRGASATGIILGASAGAFFGLYAVCVRWRMKGVSSVYAFAAISCQTAIVMITLMLFRSDERSVLDMSWTNITYLVVSAFLGIALGHICYYASIARLGIAVSSAVVQLAPFIGAVVSVIYFKEHLTAGQWGSGVLMLMGGALVLKSERLRRAPQSRFPVEVISPNEVQPCPQPVLVKETHDRAP